MKIKYKAMTQVVKDQKAFQSFFSSIDSANDWAVEIAKKYSIRVEVYELTETLLKTVEPPPAQPAPVKTDAVA